MDGSLPWPAFWAPPQQEWRWPPEGGSGGSPSSSPGSGSLSPAESPLCPAAAPPGPRRASPRTGAKSGRAGWLAPGQRQSASQREKLRMRRLARALHNLRRYLPPSVAPAGQSLTKIETLRLAIRYIGHLSELLGQGQEAPPRREPPPASRCRLCRSGPDCCRPEPAPESCCWASLPRTPRLDPSGAPPASPASWLSPGGDEGAEEAEALLLPAELAALGISPQGLRGELLSFLEDLLPPAAHQ